MGVTPQPDISAWHQIPKTTPCKVGASSPLQVCESGYPSRAALAHGRGSALVVSRARRPLLGVTLPRTGNALCERHAEPNRANGRRAVRNINLGPRPFLFWHREPQNRILVVNNAKKTVKRQAKRELTNAQLIESPGFDKEISDKLAEIQAKRSLKIHPGSSAEGKDAWMTACVARYREFAPADATERLLASLCVGLQNAAMTSLEHAA